MAPTLLYPDDAAQALAVRLRKVFADWICTELTGAVVQPVELSLRRGVRPNNLVEKVDLENWYDWRSAWKTIDLSGLDGVLFRSEAIRVVKVLELAPRWLRIESLTGGIAALERLGRGREAHEFFLAAQLGKRLSSAGAVMTSTGLKAAGQLGRVDLEAAISTVVWLRDNPDLGLWTLRQLPIPSADTKWVKSHLWLLAELTGRNLASETRPRLSIVHLTYLDPQYLAGGRRRHDAWTSCDQYELAYQPETVLVVENRDCRLWFPEFENAVVVEGGGREAPSLLKNVAWVRSAKHLVY